MKMRIIKMFLLPIAVVTLASAAAVSTDKSHESSTALTMDVYIHSPSENDCLKKKEANCEPGNGQECTVGLWQAFGLTEIGCNERLQRIGG